MNAWNYLNPIEDAYVSQYYADTNFGGAAYLYTNRYRGPADDYQSLLKFGLLNNFVNFDSTNVFPLKLRLKIYRNEIPTSMMLYVYRVLADWSELNVTWNNRPAIESAPVGSTIVNAGNFDWVEIPLTSFPNNGAYYNLLLKCDQPFDSLLGFYSREFGDSNFWPQLWLERFDMVEKPTVRISPRPSIVLPPELVRVCDSRDNYYYDCYRLNDSICIRR